MSEHSPHPGDYWGSRALHLTKPGQISPSPRKLEPEPNYLSLRAWEFPTLGIPVGKSCTSSAQVRFPDVAAC